MRRAHAADIPHATIANMHEDIDTWPGSPVPVLYIEKYLCRMV